MTTEDAAGLTRFINGQSERFEATVCAIGACTLVVLRDRVQNTIPTPVMDPQEYLSLMHSDSALVESAPELRRILAVWLHLPRGGGGGVRPAGDETAFLVCASCH